jgi:maltose alpha-D-glucosyltransferase/alpha-amylase
MAGFWHIWVSAMFLRGYMEVASKAAFLPPSREDLEVLLNSFLLEKAIYELGYELNNQPDWVKILLRGIRQVMQGKR